MVSFSKFLHWQDNPPRPRPFRSTRIHDPEPYLNSISDQDFIDRFRIDKHGLDFFVEKLESGGHFQRTTVAGLSVKTRLLVALNYYANGKSVIELQNTCGMHLSAGSVFNSVRDVSSALATLKDEFVCFSLDTETVVATKRGFSDYGQFPACVGSIDCTHIQIKPPSFNEEIYVNRKGFHSINVQLICDINLVFTDAIVKWPGSTHDTAIWNQCAVNDLLKEYNLSEEDSVSWLIGDSGYPQRPNLMITLTDPKTPEEEEYNKRIKKCRNSIERAIGTLKSRFRVLDRKTNGAVQYEVSMACTNVP